MFLSKMALPRRTFLRGMGVSLGLPLLDAMVPAASALANTAAKPVRRLGFVYIPNGAVMPSTPTVSKCPQNFRLILHSNFIDTRVT